MKRYLDLLKETFRQWNSHEAPRMGPALAFYGVLSLAPLVILVVGICALVFGTAGAQAQLLEQFRAMVGDEGALAIEAVLKSAQKPTTGVLASVFGLITLLLGASGVFIELRAALNKLWDAESSSVASGIWSFIKDRFLSRHGSGDWFSAARLPVNQRSTGCGRKVFCELGFSPAPGMGSGQFHCLARRRGVALRAHSSFRA